MNQSGRPRNLGGGRIGLFARLALAAGLTAYLVWRANPRDVAAATTGADWRPVAAAVLLVLIDRILMAYRWVALLCTLEPGQRPPMASLMRVFFTSTFIGTFLPGSVGGDAVRSYGTVKLNVPGGDAVASVLMDRILGVAAIFLMALVGLLLAHDLASDAGILAGLVASAAVCGLTMMVVFTRVGAAAAAAVVRWIPAASLQRMGGRLLDSVRKYAGHPGPLVKVLLVSVAVQVLRILQAYCLGRAIHIEAPLSAYFAFIPLILLVMLLPITFNGIGTSQWAFVSTFARIGVAAAPALAMSFLFVALGIVGNLPGAMLFAAGGGNAGPGVAASPKDRRERSG